MKEFLQLIMTNPPLLVGSLGLIANATYGIVLVVVNMIKKLRKGEDIPQTLEHTYLELKEIARKLIYEKEELFKSVTLGGVKTGPFKLDSVLSSIESECLKRGVEYDSLYWTDYVNAEVKSMKGVK